MKIYFFNKFVNNICIEFAFRGRSQQIALLDPDAPMARRLCFGNESVGVHR